LEQILAYPYGDLNFQICPFGQDRIRLVSFADFVGLSEPTSLEKKQFSEILTNQLKYLLPNITWESQSSPWVGFRPMTPDNLPYVGKDRGWKNLYISCGHGSNGWTTSAGTAQILSQQVSEN